ncbi:MAG TPA: hypothetical protein VN151_03610, partial [Terracidiphilus sp.]|nr:hypothetical protein [Terracidiphilus sp.]
EFLAPVVGPREEAGGSVEYLLMGLAVLVALIGWFTAHSFFKPGSKAIANIDAEPAGFAKVLANKYYVDEIYSFLFVKPLLAISKFLLEWVVDFAILGGLAWLLAGITQLSGAILQRWQSGNIRSYAAWLALGAAALLLFVLVPWGSVLANYGIHLGMVGR